MWQLFHRSSPLVPAVALVLAAGFPAPVGASPITGLTVTPAEARAGSSVSATATGSGLCGAVHIDWGDGAAITYATSTLPVTQAHVYQAAGTFTLRAQGMGNCSGQATAVVTITAPPPPPPPPPPPAAPPGLKAIELSPPAGAPRAPVTITLQGNGTCRIAVDFGDGNSQELAGALPLSVRHTYAVAGSYAIVATPATPCGGRQTVTLAVGDRPKTPRLTGIAVTVVPGGAGMRAIEVSGEGPCAYTLDYGDGNSEPRNGALPDVIRHNYAAPGRYTIITTPAPPCTGVLRGTIIIGAGAGIVSEAGIVTRIDVQPRTVGAGQTLTVAIDGSGSCRFTVDFGNQQVREITAPLPHKFAYEYAERGDYEVSVRTTPPCTGQATTPLRVRRR